MSDLVKRLRIKAGMIEMGEMIAWGSDSALMREAADALDHVAVERKKVGRPQIREAFLRNGAVIPADRDDLPDWVYESVFELLDSVIQQAGPAVPVEPVCLRQRLFSGWAGCSNHGCVAVDPKPGMARTNGSCQCVVNASRSQLYMLQSRIQSLIAAPQPAEQQPVYQRCEYCDGTGDVHSIDGEWRGACDCQQPADQQPAPGAITAGMLEAIWRDGFDAENYDDQAYCQPLIIARIAVEEAQLAPDVSQLVEALEKIAAFQPKDILCGSGWKEWNRAGEYAASIARDALAAHRKQGGE